MVDRHRSADLLEIEEPIGIIISRGSRAPEVPRFSAYVWGPVPSDAAETPGASVVPSVAAAPESVTA